MTRYIYRFIVAASVLLFPAVIYSQTLPFTAVNYDAGSVARAGASCLSTSSAAYGAFANPAAVPFYDGKGDFAAGYAMWAPKGVNTNVISAAGAYNVADRFGVTAGFSYGMNPAYDIYDASGASKGLFKPSEMQFMAGVAYRFIPAMSVGVNVGYASASLSEAVSYGAVTTDVFLMGEFNGFKVAAGVSDLGGSVVSASGAKFGLPASAAVALGYGSDIGEAHGIDLEVDAEYAFSGAFGAAFGAEYNFRKLVFVRAGYRYGGETVIPSFASAGVGVHIAGIRIDAAYLFANEVLGNTLAISLGYSF